MKVRTAVVLKEARTMLQDYLCACGHVDADHYLTDDRRCSFGTCRCRRFDPVRFTVTIAKGK